MFRKRLLHTITERIKIMKKIAIYGKGGIGKSTMTGNLSAAFSVLGQKVVQIGCDPKADSTINLLGGEPLVPVMDYYRDHDEEPDFEHVGKTGFGGVYCIETGGPTPGLGARSWLRGARDHRDLQSSRGTRRVRQDRSGYRSL